jgi:hypothetical protein
MSKPPHDSLMNCAWLLMWKTQPRVHFWLVDKLSRLQPWLELCQLALLKPRLARQEVLLPPRVARALNYNIISKWMAYYSRYATGKKGVMLRFSLLQLVTSEREVIAICEAQPTQSLPCFAVFQHILAVGTDSRAPTCPSSSGMCAWHRWPCPEAHLYHEASAIRRCPLSTLWAGHHICFLGLSTEG